jgi:guanylate kinase
MEEEIENASFVQTANLFGNLYGTSFKSIDKVTEEGKICIMDLETEV